jgi:hypothetical protein
MAEMEFRVVYKREGLRRKVRRFCNRPRSAERFIGLLISSEPWRFMRGEPSPDGYVCCNGRECGCHGETVREHCDRVRAELPPLEYARIETREVGEWAASVPLTPNRKV